jgi:hypothetical protein
VLQPAHDVIDASKPGNNSAEHLFEIGEVLFGEMYDPAAGLGEFVASPYIRSRYRRGEILSAAGTPVTSGSIHSAVHSWP